MRTALQNAQAIYLENLISELTPFEKKSREASEKLGLAGISLSREEAHLLRWLVASQPAVKAVEIGTLTGLSGLYILDGLMPSGKLWTLEKSEAHALEAKPILEEFAKEKGKSVELVLGDARETLKKVSNEGPFDFIFVDGNKAAYGDYLDWAENNLRPGGLLVADNVFLSGAVYGEEKPQFSDKQIRIMQDFNKRLMDSRIWNAAPVPTSEGLFVAKKI